MSAHASSAGRLALFILAAVAMRSTALDANGTGLCYPDNKMDIELTISDIDSSAANFAAGMQSIIADQLALNKTCVDITGVSDADGNSRRLTSTGGTKVQATAQLDQGVTTTQAAAALKDASATNDVCNAFGTSATCAISNAVAVVATTAASTTTTTGVTPTVTVTVPGPVVTKLVGNSATVTVTVTAPTTTPTTTTTTTTSEMPWGLPWWAWFLICCGLLLCCALCFGAAGGGVAGTSARKTGTKSRENSFETTYEVVDEPFGVGTSFVDEAGMPMASVTLPIEAVLPVGGQQSSSASIPMASAIVPDSSTFSTAGSYVAPVAFM